jgi:MFS transporter, MHS family, proline/betaine transporter
MNSSQTRRVIAAGMVGNVLLGLLAPAALTLLRMVQGLSVGGEYTSSMVFLVERAPEGWRRT